MKKKKRAVKKHKHSGKKGKKKTKIRVIKDKKKLKKGKVIRVSTGIKNFDKLIQGGFEKNSTNLVVASGGSGKTIFAAQFLIEGIKKGEKCLYITFEEKRDEFFSNMMGLGWDLYKYEKEGKFFFLEYTPEKVKTMLEEGGGVIETLVLTKKIQRIAMDSITSFGLLFENEFQKRTSALALFNMLRKWECTSVLTYERDPLRDVRTTSRILEFESDSIILLYYVRAKKERQRYIEVLKMRGTDHSKDIWPFYIEKGAVRVGTKPFRGEIKNLI